MADQKDKIVYWWMNNSDFCKKKKTTEYEDKIN
jgi:hypothetical protein